MDYSKLTLVIPAKEEVGCLYKVLEELRNFNFHKIIVIPSNASLPKNWTFQNIKILNQSKIGYGNALLEGIKNVKTEFFCILIGNSTQKQKSLLLTPSSLNFEVFAITYVYRMSDNFNLKKILPIFEKI